MILDLAVITPTESIFVTSSYVKVPPIDTLPENTPLTPVTLPEAITFPVTSIPAPQSKFPGISMCPSELTTNLPTLLVESQILKLPALPYSS